MNDKGEIVLYQNQEGHMKIDAHLQEDTVWLTQGQMALLFDKDRTTVNRHVGNIFKEGELDKKVVCAYFAQTTQVPGEKIP